MLEPGHSGSSSGGGGGLQHYEDYHHHHHHGHMHEVSPLFKMLDILSRYKGVMPLRRGIPVDDGWDQLNRTIMFLTLCIFSMIVTVRQYTGHVISCDGFKKFSDQFSQDYCWTQGLHTLAEAYDQPLESVPYPGIIPEDIPPCIEGRRLAGGGTINCPDPKRLLPNTRVYHLWYQWVPFYFLLCAIAFYFPYLMYKNFGMGDIRPLLNLLHNPVDTEDELEKAVNKAATWLYYRFATYMHSSSSPMAKMQKHRLGIIIVFTKLSYLAVTLTSFYLTTLMFELGNFLTYGKDWVQSVYSADYANATTAVRDRLFPKMVSCEIKRWGTSGIEEEHGTCVLAPNVINQYLFLITWFMLVGLIISNSFSVVLSFIRLAFTYGSYRRILFLSFLKDDAAFKTMYYNVGSSGRVILHMLANNIRPKVFEDMVRILASRLKRHNFLDSEIKEEYV